MTFEACEACGAITAVRQDNGNSIDNTEQHATWHAQHEAAIIHINLRLDAIRPGRKDNQ